MKNEEIPREKEKATFWIFCKEYTNRWGQRMVASNYGYHYWRFPIKNRKG